MTAQRSLLVGSGSTTLGVAGAAGTLREGLVPYSLPGVVQVLAVSPCRLAFQLLKHPIVRITLSTDWRLHGHQAYVEPRTSFTDPDPHFTTTSQELYFKNCTLKKKLHNALSFRWYNWIPQKHLMNLSEDGGVRGRNRLSKEERNRDVEVYQKNGLWYHWLLGKPRLTRLPRRNASPEPLLFATSSEHTMVRSTRFDDGSPAMAAVAVAVVENETEIHSALTAKDWQWVRLYYTLDPIVHSRSYTTFYTQEAGDFDSRVYSILL